MKAKTKTVAAYLAALSPDKRKALERLRKIIRRVAPKAEERISYGIIGYRVDGKMAVYIGAGANHCAMYGVHNEKDLLAGYDTTGRGTLRFQPDEPLPEALVRKLVKARIAKNAAPKRARGR